MNMKVKELAKELSRTHDLDVDDLTSDEITNMIEGLTTYNVALKEQEKEYEAIRKEIFDFFSKIRKEHPDAEIFVGGENMSITEDDIEVC